MLVQVSFRSNLSGLARKLSGQQRCCSGESIAGRTAQLLFRVHSNVEVIQPRIAARLASGVTRGSTCLRIRCRFALSSHPTRGVAFVGTCKFTHVGAVSLGFLRPSACRRVRSAMEQTRASCRRMQASSYDENKLPVKEVEVVPSGVV